VDPVTGDVFAGLLYDSAPPNGPHRPKVIRLHSTDGGLTASSQATVLDMAPEQQEHSHQISNLTIGPDGKLYVHMGDGFVSEAARNLSFFRGKILRLNLDGTAPADNPHYNGAPIDATDYVFARGFRNPFGGAWRTSNGVHYQVENGPTVDRVTRVNPGGDYGWDGDDVDMFVGALYTWTPSHAPINMAFVQPQTFGGSGFPASMQDHAFVTESGPTWATGPQTLGKRIVEFAPQAGGEIGGLPQTFVEYTGTGKGTAAALAAGPDGLYFTDLYRDLGYGSPIDLGARLFRIRYAPAAAGAAAEPFDLKAAKKRCKRKFSRKKARKRCIRKARKKAGL
jgi:glucose/arabinose dehydrogenase